MRKANKLTKILQKKSANMNIRSVLIVMLLLSTACTSQKKLAYLGNLPEGPGDQFFEMNIPEYKIQNRDVLYITLKAMDHEGVITDYLNGAGIAGLNTFQTEGGGYLFGYLVNPDGNIILPVLGQINVAGKTLDAIREQLQAEFSKNYRNTIVECKLLSYKFTVIGEVKAPGTYLNYNNYLTVLEAIGRAGGIADYGRRDRILVVRPSEKGTQTFTLNLQDKAILNSEAYFLLPNDVVIIEPQNTKIFNMNLPTISFALTTVASIITTTLLLINYLK
jgi:polysaccharide biosynthesis/export protein